MTDTKIYQLLKRVKSSLTSNELDAELEMEINILVSNCDIAVQQSEKLAVLLYASSNRFDELNAILVQYKNRSFFARLFNF